MKEKGELLEILGKAQANKRKSCIYYEDLAANAPEERMQEISRKILANEQQHLELLNILISKIAKQQEESDETDVISGE
jgi:rubrerythrin